VFVQLDSVGRHGLAGRLICAQLAHFQLDAPQRFLGGRVVDGRDCRHRFAAVAHALARQRILRTRNREHAKTFVAIGAGHDRFHARQLRGF
jgi:hypothetical protein